MHFTPPPANDFREFYETYFTRCRERVPQIRAVAAKWCFEDLIPGLSDFDTRFILEDGMEARDWHAMSLAVGETHTDLALERPAWARNLEHLPGLNLMISELTDPSQFYSEFQQWTFYDGDAGIIERLESSLSERQWTTRDEIYHVKRVATFFGPYMRGIDPPVNLGAWENKYPLHSRFMHYFTPPMQAIVSLALRRTVRGKREALQLARGMFSNTKVIDLIFESLERHYELPELYREPGLTDLERRLERCLAEAWGAIADRITVFDAAPEDTRESIQRKIRAMPADPVEEFFSRVKFARLMKGRLLFYAREVPCFDSTWLIENELGRMVNNLFHRPLQAYGVARFGEEMETDAVLDRLCGEVLDKEDIEGMKTFARIAGETVRPGMEKQQAKTVAEVYDPVLPVLEKLRAGILAPEPVKAA